MGGTNNGYETIRTKKGYTAQADALAITQTSNTQSGSSKILVKVASAMFTGLAVFGLLLLVLLVIDTVLFNGRLLTEVLARL
jgi:hypothetical protein